MKKLPELNKNEIDTLVNAHKQMLSTKPEGQAVALDPSNALHKKLILTALKAAGQTKDKYPHLYHAIDSGQFSTEGGPDKMIVVDAGADANGHAIAHTWLANNKGTLYSGSSLFVMDGTADNLLAHGAATDVHSGFMQNHTDAQTAKKAGASVRVLGVNHMIAHDGTVRFTAVAGSRFTNVSSNESLPSTPSPYVQEPKNTNTTYPAAIKIGVGRTTYPTDCDYWYDETVNTSTNPNLIVPFTGSYTLPYTINGTAGNSIPGLTISTVIYCSISGTTNTASLDSNYPKPVAPVPGNYGISPSNDSSGSLTVLDWSFPYGTGGEGRETTNSLVYDTSPVTDSGTFAFFYQFTVPCSDAPGGYYTFCVASASNPFPSTNCIQIPNLQYWWHCLAAGTQVSLHDSTYLDIEKINNTHRVLSGSFGADLGVEATAMGLHKATKGQEGMQAVYRLQTEDKNELVATGVHPIITPFGAVMLCHLNIGDTVMVTGGTSKVVVCESIDYSGMFYDLKLGTAEDRAKMPNNPVNTYYANGILVGDHAALTAQADRQRYDLDYILPRINASFRTDYISSVKDRHQYPN